MAVLTVVGNFSFDLCNLTELKKYIYPPFFFNTGEMGWERDLKKEKG